MVHLYPPAVFNRIVEVNTINLPLDARKIETARLNLINQQKMYHLPEPQRRQMLQNPKVATRLLTNPYATPDLPPQYAQFKAAVNEAISLNAINGPKILWIIVNMDTHTFYIQSAEHMDQGKFNQAYLDNFTSMTLQGNQFIVSFVSVDAIKQYYRKYAGLLGSPENDISTNENIKDVY